MSQAGPRRPDVRSISRSQCHPLSGCSADYLALLLAVWLCFYYISDVDYLVVMPIIWHYLHKDRSPTTIIVLLQSADDEEFNAYFSAYMDIN